MSVWDKLFESITSSDLYIVIFAIIELVLLGLSVFFAYSVKVRIEQWKRVRNEEFSHYLFAVLNVVYSLFITVITIFPLLGMFGTVGALLSVNMAGDMAALQNRFFDALTSTAWGIIFAIIFKVLNAVIAPFVEEQIEDAKKFSEGLLESDEDNNLLRKSENIVPVSKAEEVERFFGEAAVSREEIFKGSVGDKKEVQSAGIEMEE